MSVVASPPAEPAVPTHLPIAAAVVTGVLVGAAMVASRPG
jgi:hypothetical protein